MSQSRCMKEGQKVDGLAESAFTVEALEAAWHVVLANDSADGTLAPGTTRFSENADVHIEGTRRSACGRPLLSQPAYPCDPCV